MTLTLLCLFIFPAAIGLGVSFMLNEDERSVARRRGFFALKKPHPVLCFEHLSHRKKKQIALIDPNNCKVCIAKSKKRK